jgi:hypothetical protein
MNDLTPVEDLLDDLDQHVWGAESIGRIIRRSEAQAFHLLNRGLLDADKVGNRWTSTPRRLLRSLSSKHTAA